MKNYAILLFSFFMSLKTFAQNGQNVGCMDRELRQQGQEQANIFLSQNFVVRRDAMLNMHGRQPFSVITSLERGAFYQIIFVASPKSNPLLELFNENDELIGAKKQTLDNNKAKIISFSFVPEYTGSFLFVLTQKMKNVDVCGSFTILELQKTPSTNTSEQ